MSEIESQIFVKISVYNGVHVDKVVYYRNKLPMRIVEKWRWYFEYIAARIKVTYPIKKVELTIGRQDLLQGEEYVKEKIKNLLKHRRSRLKKLIETPVETDLFSFKAEERQRKINQVKAEIDSLEKGEYNGYIPSVYINDIKNWIK